MGLLTPGHFQSNHFPSNHWVDSHWLNWGPGVPASFIEIIEINSPITIEMQFDSKITKIINTCSPLGE